MAEYLIQESTLTAIADAIRAKNESSEAILPSEMAGLIEGLSSGGCNFISGTFIGNQKTIVVGNAPTYQVSLGMELPESDNFCLVVFFLSETEVISIPTDSIIAQVIKNVNGTMVNYSLKARGHSSSTAAYTTIADAYELAISDTDGTSILKSKIQENGYTKGLKWVNGKTYEWWYCYG